MARAGDGGARSDKRRATHRLTKRVTPAERERFRNRAADSGFTNDQEYLSAFVSGDIRMHAATRKEAIRALGELGKIGSNINQIARAANEGRIQTLDANAAVVLDRMRREVEQLGQEIREALR